MSDYDEQDLGNDVISTVNALMDVIEKKKESKPDPDNPMASMMDPKELIATFKPQLFQKVQNKPEKTVQAMAVIHQASGDILRKHAPDRDVSELASEAMQD